MSPWIDKYPRVKALLQGDDELLYGVEGPDVDTPPPLSDADYCTRIQALIAAEGAHDEAYRQARGLALQQAIREEFGND